MLFSLSSLLESWRKISSFPGEIIYNDPFIPFACTFLYLVKFEKSAGVLLTYINNLDGRVIEKN